MNPEEDFYYGLGILVATVIMIFTWVVITYGFDSEINIGSFFGVTVLGIYYLWRGVKKGRKNA